MEERLTELETLHEGQWARDRIREVRQEYIVHKDKGIWRMIIVGGSRIDLEKETRFLLAGRSRRYCTLISDEFSFHSDIPLKGSLGLMALTQRNWYEVEIGAFLAWDWTRPILARRLWSTKNKSSYEGTRWSPPFYTIEQLFLAYICRLSHRQTDRIRYYLYGQSPAVGLYPPRYTKSYKRDSQFINTDLKDAIMPWWTSAAWWRQSWCLSRYWDDPVG